VVLGSVAKTTKTRLNHKKNHQNHYKPQKKPQLSGHNFPKLVQKCLGSAWRWYKSDWEVHGAVHSHFGASSGVAEGWGAWT